LIDRTNNFVCFLVLLLQLFGRLPVPSSDEFTFPSRLRSVLYSPCNKHQALKFL